METRNLCLRLSGLQSLEGPSFIYEPFPFLYVFFSPNFVKQYGLNLHYLQAYKNVLSKKSESEEWREDEEQSTTELLHQTGATGGRELLW